MVSMSSTITIGADIVLPSESGPVTRQRQRRSLALYFMLCAAGLVPWLLGWSASLQAAGLGLWLPGAGFIVDGGWAIVLFPLALLLFAASFVAWFGSGMIVAPIIVWLGSALLAAALAGPGIFSAGPYLVIGLTALAVGFFTYRSRKALAAGHAVGAERRAALPAVLAEVRARAVAETPTDRLELDADQLGATRYLFDRAMQPLNALQGFDIRDQFQTAAVRYQLNYVGYTLAQLQARYAPSFHGYLSEAQRQVIDQYTQRKVWGYWIYESMWGHLNFTNFDPCGKDNIMLTGYFNGQVALYQGTTGDQRYSEDGSLNFRLNDKTVFKHSLHSINRSITDNFEASPYCLYPCEPNWIYPGCNFRGLWSAKIYDRVFGANHVDGLIGRWVDMLDREFTDASGGVVPLRSSVTGLALPFPADDVMTAVMANSLIPARAERYWAIGQRNFRKALSHHDGKLVLDLPNEGIDFGNYRKGNLCFMSAVVLDTAREFGDAELAEAALNTLDTKCQRSDEGGTIRYLAGSNLANLLAINGKLTTRGSNRGLVLDPMPESVLRGPLLTEVTYPEVLVARAWSDGDALDLVLHPGAGVGTRKIGVSRLKPSQTYRLAGSQQLDFKADAGGHVWLDVELRGRTALRIVPTQIGDRG